MRWFCVRARLRMDTVDQLAIFLRFSGSEASQEESRLEVGRAMSLRAEEDRRASSEDRDQDSLRKCSFKM